MPGQLAHQKKKNIVIKKIEAQAPAIRTQFGVKSVHGGLPQVLMDNGEGFSTCASFNKYK